EVTTEPLSSSIVDCGLAADPCESAVRVEHLSKTYRRDRSHSVQAVEDTTLTIGAGEVMVLLGPCGCGKTTLLRCIAGLERPDSGEIYIGGQKVFSDGGV